jgi:hypothetical protein
MTKFPYKIHLTVPEKVAKSDLSKTIMGLKPSSYKVHGLNEVRFEWEYKTPQQREWYLPGIIDTIKEMSIKTYEVSIMDI